MSKKTASDVYPPRQVALEIIPIRQPTTYNLAIIASVFHEAPDDLARYASYISDEFGGSCPSLQVLFCDNTPEARLRPAVLEMRGLLPPQVDFQPLVQPTPGKIHGLNACLERVTADYVMPTDPNKQPAPGTMRGLYQRITSTNQVNLLSAREIRKPNRTSPIQFYNSGAIHIGRRWCFPGFPEILSDDEYTLRLTSARGGAFQVA